MASEVPIAEIALDPPSRDERNTALFMWLLNIVVHILGPWIYWHVAGRGSAFVTHHFKNCVNHILTILILILIACVVFGGVSYLAITFEYLYTTIALIVLMLVVILGLGLASLIIQVIAALKAEAGECYTPPLCWRFTK